MNLAFRFPIIYWNTACLIVNSGSLEDTSIEEEVDIFEPEDDIAEGVVYIDAPDKKTKIRKISTDYGKVARALGDTLKAGIKISLTDINKSSFGFKPDVKNNQILFGLKGLLNVSDEIIAEIITHRPYSSPKDFITKVKPKKQVMISLIKSGAFDEMIDRRKCMVWYLWSVCDKKRNLTLQNMPGLIKYNLLPEDNDEQIMARRVYEFNRYLKACCKISAAEYQLTDRAIDFLAELDQVNLIKENNILNAKTWDKVYQKWMDVFRKWLSENKTKVLDEINNLIFMDEWNKYAKNGNISAWEMEAMCFYYHDHELINLNNAKYGISNFFTLPEEPVVDKTFVKKDKEINLYKLTRIAGTCIAKNKNKSTVTLLTTTGVVNVKMTKTIFSMFDRQISQKDEKGVKHVVEKSFFERGSLLLFQGIRREDNFITKNYKSSGGHQVYKIEEINERTGDIILRHDRYDTKDENY